MKKLLLFFLVWPALASWSSLVAEGKPEVITLPNTEHANIKELPHEKLISFRFNQASLLEIIDMLAKEMGINIVIPAGQQTITEKITFQIPHKITIDEAWERLLGFLRICSYSVIMQKEFVSIVKNDPKETTRQPFALYVHTNAELLPECDERIRYLYYFYNLQLVSTEGGSVVDILQSLLSKDATILIDESTNGVIITDTARHIASAITILKELDARQAGDDGKEIIRLRHTIASNIAAYLQSIINPTGKQTASDILAPSLSQFFSKGIRVVAEPRSNSLILLGKKEPLARIKNFIEEFIDIKLDAGESILHIYDLQYLDAATFKQTLSSIIASQSESSYGSQSSGSAQGSAGQQYFKDVKIVAEATEAINPASLASTSAGSVDLPKQAGNRLIIAARRDDWLRIEKLIKELDKPQLQVAMEVLIVDLSITEDKALGAQMRNLAELNLKDVNFQTSHLGGNDDGAFVQIASNGVAGNDLQGNLLTQTASQTNMASKLDAGSFVLSFKDPATNGIWLVSQMLNTYSDVKILSQPFVIALNNQSCSFSSDETRLLAGGSNVIPGGGGVQSFREKVTASLSVVLTPMISRDMRISLALDINISEYQGDTSTQLRRHIHTNVNVKDGDVLVLGGLTKTQMAKNENRTPLLSRIPIIGNLFKSRVNNKTKENLLVFISPRIILPRKGSKFDSYTANKIINVNKMFDRSFDSFKDPITHWFFGDDDEELAVQKVKALGKRDLFNNNIQEDEDRASNSNIIVINKHEQLPKESIKKSTTHIPSPDKVAVQKTITGLPKLVINKSAKKEPATTIKTPEKADPEIKTKDWTPGKQAIAAKKVGKTPTGLPMLVIKAPENAKTRAKNKQNKTGDNNNEQKQKNDKKDKQAKRSKNKNAKKHSQKTDIEKEPEVGSPVKHSEEDDLKQLAAQLKKPTF